VKERANDRVTPLLPDNGLRNNGGDIYLPPRLSEIKLASTDEELCVEVALPVETGGVVP